MSGKLIVLEGGDGSGKATQTALLAERLKREGYPVARIEFPRYGEPSAYFVERYLNGEYGTTAEIGAQRGSLFFALDRYDASFEMKLRLEEGKNIIANRYTTANMGHMGGEILEDGARKKFFDWLCHLEYEILKIPKPDLVIYLHVPAEIGQRYVDQKGERKYIRGEEQRDMLEKNLSHQKRAEKVFLELADSCDNWEMIECARDNNFLPKEEIHEKIWEKTKQIL